MDRKKEKIIVSNCYAGIAAAMNKAVEIITAQGEESAGDLLGKGLRPIAEAAGLDRVAIYQRLNDNNRMGQTYVWADGKTQPLDDEMVSLPCIPPVVKWIKQLTRGECINANVKDLCEFEAVFLNKFGIKAVFLYPCLFPENSGALSRWRIIPVTGTLTMIASACSAPRRTSAPTP